jgi:predicted CoA-binding protein
MEKQTVVIGASPNPDRYAYKATVSLKRHGYKVIPIGIRGGEIEGETILTDKPHLPHIHTVTLYVGPQNQAAWLDYILSLKPKRIIFNPGTENGIIASEASKMGIECQEACTLVLLSIGQY